MLKKLGFVDVERGWKWLKSLENELVDDSWNGKVTNSGRKCLWYGIGVKLGFKKDIYKGKEISKGLRKRGNDLWGNEDWNSILVYKYNEDVELLDHVDRKWLSKKVVIVNFCKNEVDFNYNNEIYKLRDGEVIEIDSSVKHGVREVKSERWSISFRKV